MPLVPLPWTIGINFDDWDWLISKKLSSLNYDVHSVYRNSKGTQKKEQEVYDSDDERAYENEKTPNRNDDDFYHDEVDEFHTQKEKVSDKLPV